MKKLLFALALTSSLISCKKETTTQNTNGNTNTTDITKTSTVGKPGPNITDNDGNTYKTVTIGTQTWMAENLKTAKYSDGSAIPNVTDKNQWQNNTTGAWCNYNNSDSLGKIYGKLYNWYAVSPTTNGNKNVCPTGWHVPTDAEWTVLTNYLGGDSVAGGKMKEVGTSNWNSPNTDATNTSLFTGLPGGGSDYPGVYNGIGSRGYWWSSSSMENTTFYAWFRILERINGSATRVSYPHNVESSFSVRCLKD